MLIKSRNKHFQCAFTLLLILATITLSSCTTENTPSYQLTTSAVPTEGGTVSPPSGEYGEGEEVQIQATANENWLFDGWEGGQTGSQNPVTVTMNSDKDIRARFVKKQYSLTINYEGEGTVTETVVQPKMTDYEYGTLVELEANSATGHNFGRWMGDLESTENPVRIMMDGPKEITVVFDPMEYSIQARADGPGTASVNPQKEVYVYNETVTFEAVPNPNVQFVGWFNESGSFEMLVPVFEHQVEGDLDITAFFRTVNNAFVVETASITSSDGVVERVIFNIYNYLLDDIELIGADLDDEEGDEVGILRFDTPPVIAGRSALEVRVTFEGDLTPDAETIKQWVFNWLFEFQDESYEKAQKVGEPASNAKQKPFLIKDVEIKKSVLVDIK